MTGVQTCALPILSKHFDTLSIHANQQHYALGAVVTPIYQSSTFEFENCDVGGARFAGTDPGPKYTRLGNPTNEVLEGKIAELEGAEACAVVSSGMAAISSTVFTLLKAGDHLISDNTLYGCTIDLFGEQLTKFGVQVEFLDLSIPGEVTKHLKPNTKIVYYETPSNPTLKIIDHKRVCEEAHKQKGVIVISDNTFASPILTRPMEYGVDIVVHSMTKYINGHTDVVAGCVCGKKDVITQIKNNGIKDITGAVMSPHDAFLVIRGLMTLDLRVRRAAENAQKIAEYLESNPKVEKVYYPGLKSHKGHEIAMKQMELGGSMISFELKGGLKAGKTLLDNLKLITLAVSLGGCESLIQHPASMTHAGVPADIRKQSGLTDGLCRFSVGIENVDDLINDLKQAFEKVN